MQKVIKNIIMSLIIPAATYVFFAVLCSVTGHSGFGTGTDLQTILFTSVYSGLIAFALSINLSSGRFDFSIGATMVLAIILGGNIAKEYDLNGLAMLIITVLIAAVIGCISGLVYVLLGLPPMVASLGMAMIYEAIGFMYNRAKGVKLIGRSKLLIFSKFPTVIIIMVIVLVILIILYDYTKFGFNRSALATGQKIAVDMGINEKRNAVICYAIAGALLGIAGCVYISKYGTVTPETGLSSSSYFMTAFLPMFIGGAIAKYSSYPLAVYIGALTQACITSGLSAMGASNSLMTIINGIIVLIFLIYTSNNHKIVEFQMYKQKLEKAKQIKLNEE